MTDDDIQADPGSDDPSDDKDNGPLGGRTFRIPIDPETFDRLVPFRDMQRIVAGADFVGMRAIQQLASSAMRDAWLPYATALQESVQSQIARSIDFGSLSRMQVDLGKLMPRVEVFPQKEWAEIIAQSTNMSALLNVSELLKTVELPALAETQRMMAETLASRFAGIQEAFKWIDVGALMLELDRWVPVNLRDVDDLEAVAEVALDDGIPLSWVPRTSIVTLLIEAGTPEDRADLLDTHHKDILDDCREVLTEVPHQWAQECDAAIRALDVGLDGPAQSHAANIIDSIVLCTLGPKDGRQRAKKKAVEEFEELALRVVGENLVLRPLYRALTTWYPGTGTPPPDHFARHATAHAVGNPGLFQRRHALVAVMLAVSLTVQFWDDPASAPGVLPPDSTSDGDSK